MIETSHTSRSGERSDSAEAATGSGDHASQCRLIPNSRVIRKRVAARTTAIHICALARAPWAGKLLADADADGYLQKHAFPEAVEIRDVEGHRRMLSREQAWRRADARAAALEWTLLSGVTGRIAAFFSRHGQGVYANYGRPTMDFSGFFWDRVTASAAADAASAPPGRSVPGRSVIGNATPAVSAVQVGPLFIAADTAAASGLTALGYLARGASLANPVVASDVLSTGAYEGTSAWATAKLGVFTGVKAMAVAASLPLAGAPVATVMAGLTVGATTAITAKYAVNRLKDHAIDAAQKATGVRVRRDRRWRHA